MGFLDKFKKPKRNSSKNINDEINTLEEDKDLNINFNNDIDENIDLNINHDEDINLDNNTHDFSYLNDLLKSNVNEINLDKDFVISDNEESIFSEGIVISSNDIIINGNGHYIDACGKIPIFSINADNITIKNITFKNGFSDKGGSILNKGNSISIIDCGFENNSAKNDGGVIYNMGDSLHIINSNFKNNNSKWNGGVIYNDAADLNIENCKFINNSVDGKAGAIYNKKSDCIISNSDFNKNISRGHAGAIYNSNGEININHSHFIENTSRRNAGAIYNAKNSILFENTEFINNHSKSDGGSIFNSGGKLKLTKNCVFQDNSADRNGGAIFNDKESTIEMDKNILRDNYSKQYGGAIYNNSFLTFNGTFFIQNISKNEGGAIYNEGGSVDSYESKFIDNNSKQSASNIWSNNFLRVLNSIFIDSTVFDVNNLINSIIYLGGEEDSKLDIMGSSFFIKYLENKNIIFIDGGYSFLKNAHIAIEHDNNEDYIVYNKQGQLKIDNSKFSYNNNLFSNFILNGLDGIDELNKSVSDNFVNVSDGNTLNRKFIFNDNILKISEDENFQENVFEGSNSNIVIDYKKVLDDWKGFYYLDDLIQSNLDKKNDNGFIEINLDCDIIMDDSEQYFYEGGIDLSHDKLIIDGNGHVIDASSLSRVFYITANDIVLRNIIFKNGKYYYNHLDNDYSGGGVIKVLHNASLSIINCKFINNNSRNSAGAIYNDGDRLDIEKSLFKDNIASNFAGTIYNSKSSLKIHDNCVFEENVSGKSAGVIFNKSNSFIINNCFFSNNSSKDGGVIYDIKGSMIINDAIFENNVSEGEGGVININQGMEGFHNNKTILNDCTFRNNSAGAGGALIHYGNVFLKNCTFEENHAEYNGGAINTLVEGFLTLEHCSFTNNNCKYKGGSIFGVGCDIKAFNNCNFDYNFADQGGAIFFNGGLFELDNCHFKFNKVFGEDVMGFGGAIYKGEGNAINDPIIRSCSFESNNAFNGGAIYINGLLTIDNTIFQDNNSTNDGDSICNLGNLNLNKCDFQSKNENILVNYGIFNQVDTTFDSNSKVVNK